jgi:hypothetical protein
MVTNTCSPRDIAPNRRLDREAVKDLAQAFRPGEAIPAKSALKGRQTSASVVKPLNVS